jgi:hypothetical protein
MLDDVGERVVAVAAAMLAGRGRMRIAVITGLGVLVRVRSGMPGIVRLPVLRLNVLGLCVLGLSVHKSPINNR